MEHRPFQTVPATCSELTSPIPAKPHHSQQEPWATVKLACEDKSRNICFMIIVFNFPPSNLHFSFLGSKPCVAPARHFIKVYLKALDICQVGGQSRPCRKDDSHAPATGQSSSLQVTAVAGAIESGLLLWPQVERVGHLDCSTTNQIPLRTSLQ